MALFFAFAVAALFASPAQGMRLGLENLSEWSGSSDLESSNYDPWQMLRRPSSYTMAVIAQAEGEKGEGDVGKMPFVESMERVEEGGVFVPRVVRCDAESNFDCGYQVGVATRDLIAGLVNVC